MSRLIATLALAAGLVLAAAAPSSTRSQAYDGRIAVGIVAGVIAGVVIAHEIRRRDRRRYIYHSYAPAYATPAYSYAERPYRPSRYHAIYSYAPRYAHAYRGGAQVHYVKPRTTYSRTIRRVHNTRW